MTKQKNKNFEETPQIPEENKVPENPNNTEETPKVPEVPQETKVSEKPNKPNKPEVQVPTSNQKNVKIQIAENCSCMIAGKSYSFRKGEQVSVASDVAAILVNSQKAYRL